MLNIFTSISLFICALFFSAYACAILTDKDSSQRSYGQLGYCLPLLMYASLAVTHIAGKPIIFKSVIGYGTCFGLIAMILLIVSLWVNQTVAKSILECTGWGLNILATLLLLIGNLL